MPSLSIIIPVYNEERHIRGCLNAIANQTVPPDEVIVVDNNSQDKTVEVANEFSFVTVLSEPRRGCAYARSAGFDAAKGEILGRIDADSRIASNWVETVKRAFKGDSEIDGITGLAKSAFLPGINALKSTFFSRVYYWFAHSSFNTVTMWGSNMAIRASSWKAVRNQVLNSDADLHEDQDISLWIAGHGSKIVQVNDLLVSTNGQGFRYLPKLIRYSRMFKYTYNTHMKNGNLKSPNLRRLGFLNTLLGKIGATIVMFLGTAVAVTLFPVDFVVKQLWPKSWWLD
jgi:glycosyltransferase involved in cell wall biosynthesis